MTAEATPIEPAMVLWTRIEGKIDLIIFQVTDHAKVLDRHEVAIGNLISNVQTLTQARVTDADTRIQTAQAVKDAKDVDDERANKHWSPFQKTVAGAAGLVNLMVLWQYVIPHK